DNAIVFGCYGGKNSFDIPFVQKAVVDTAKENPMIYFIFMNIDSFTLETGSNILFLPGSVDPLEKEIFINTCNAMIHARTDGETFGLSIAEFSLKNKPIITYKSSIIHLPIKIIHWLLHKQEKYQTAHLMNLQKRAITYSGYRQLRRIFQNFSAYYDPDKNYDCFSDKFSPQNIMEKFMQIIS
ncbi:MAG: hypothetical protein LBR68_07340, partial [Lachnoclostridium sp.]|nr:hypothetical protein [Lachnoclostridium sp.]